MHGNMNVKLPSLVSSVDSSDKIVTRVQAGQSRNSGSILGRDKIISCPLKTPRPVLGSSYSLTQRAPRALSPGAKRLEHNHYSLSQNYN
jgi:hypothetical protein